MRLITTRNRLFCYVGKIDTIRQLLRKVWGLQAEGQTHYLMVYVNLLRNKLGDRLLISNESGIGYRLLVS